MRFKIACLATVAAGVLLTGAPVLAAEAPQAAVSAPSARQIELTRRYIELTMTDQFEDAMEEMIADQVAMDPTSRDLPSEDRRFISELTAELTTDMIPQMLEEMVPVYARTFTEAELEALIGFYDSEMGRSIVRKTMESMPEATRAAMAVVPQMLDKMASRICQHYGCTAEELQEMKRDMRGEASLAPAPK